jgi:hypothetical protein
MLSVERQGDDERPPVGDAPLSPPPRDAGAHGAFDAKAKTISPQLMVNTHRGAIGAAIAVIAVIGLARLLSRD